MDRGQNHRSAPFLKDFTYFGNFAINSGTSSPRQIWQTYIHWFTNITWKERIIWFIFTKN